MKYVVCGVMVALIALGVWFLGDRNDDIRNYPPKNTTIVAFGDSLALGVGATPGNDLFSQLEERIGRPIVNLGVAGNTTADGVLRMDDVIKLDPGLVFLVLGGNDTLRRVDVGLTEENLHILINAFQKSGAVVVFLGVRGGIFGSEREDMYERLAEENGVIFVPDILSGILLKPELMYDSIHPNDAGYAHIAERLEEVFSAYEL